MPIAFDAVTSSEQTGTSITWAHTCSGSNRILLVGIALNAEDDRVTGVTYTGVNMTRVLFQPNTGLGLSGYVYILINPTSGNNNVVVTINTSTAGQFKSISYTGAAQSGQPDASGSTQIDAATSHSLAITTIADNSWATSFIKIASGNPSPSTNVTERHTGTGFGSGDTNSNITPAGSITQVWTSAASTDSWQIHTSIAPQTTTSTSTSTSSSTTTSTSTSTTSTSSSSTTSTSTSTSTSTTITETTTSSSSSTSSTTSTSTSTTSTSSSTSTTSTSSSTTSTSSSSSTSTSTSTTTTYPYPFTVDNVG